jgi:hypothetical protein
MAVRAAWAWFGGLVLAAVGLGAACGGGGSGNGTNGCVPGASVSCVCPGGASGAQVCTSDGKSYGMCQCSSTGTGGSTSTISGTGGSATCQCTNPSQENYCGAPCADAGTGGSKTDGGSCVGVLTYAGKAGMQFGSYWSYQSLVGTAAGNKACMDVGADHVCDYNELVSAASKGELSTLTTSDTAWLQRTTSVTVTATSPKIVVLGQMGAMGTTYTVGPASRCNDWSYMTDHLNDGEYVDFASGTSTPTFHLDDNPSAIQAATKDIPCGHNATLRDVLCCYPKCM